MKKIIYLMMAAALMFGCTKDAPNEGGESSPCRIYGVITDKATGEPVRSAGVQLSLSGTKTITGSEGQYEFTGLKAGEYVINVTKTGYADLVNYKIIVEAGKTNKGDVQLEKLPPSLRVVNDNRQNIDLLDFGEELDDILRSFNIFNDGPESLEWQLTKTSEWITGVSKTEGMLKAGATQAVVITIDRDKLSGEENTTTIHITSDNGSKKLTVKASDRRESPELNTLDVSDITASTAVFHGKITKPGMPAYTERGFVYATSSMPKLENTIARLTAAVTDDNDYSAIATGLALNETYYVRAYAVNKTDTAYSTNEKRFTAEMLLPEVATQEASGKNIGAGRVTLNGTIVKVGDPAYTERGFVYGLTHNPTVEDDSKKLAPGTGTGVFSANLTELAEGNIYYVRAYAANGKGAAYGEEVICSFNAIMPKVTTGEVMIKETEVVFNGTVDIIGDPPYTERGFVYGSLPTPTVENATTKTVNGAGSGTYSCDMSGLLALETEYYVRAYASNGKGAPVYGDAVKFVISPYIVFGNFMIQKEDTGVKTYAEAASICQKSVVAGYDDWRLPSRGELEVIHAARNTISSELNGLYWSSTAYTIQVPCCPTCPGSSTRMCTETAGYYYLDMENGKSALGNAANARCVRSLP